MMHCGLPCQGTKWAFRFAAASALLLIPMIAVQLAVAVPADAAQVKIEAVMTPKGADPP